MVERANERMSAAERASEASSAEQAYEQMAQYSTRQFHSYSTHYAIIIKNGRWTDLTVEWRNGSIVIIGCLC